MPDLCDWLLTRFWCLPGHHHVVSEPPESWVSQWWICALVSNCQGLETGILQEVAGKALGLFSGSGSFRVKLLAQLLQADLEDPADDSTLVQDLLFASFQQ